MSSTDSSIRARDVMTPVVLGIVPSAPLEVALRMMVEAVVHHLPIVDGRRCLGVVHESDVLWRLWSTPARGRPPVGVLVRRPPLAVAVDDPVDVVARRMLEVGTDAALVLEHGELAGIVTRGDLLRLLAAG